MFIYFTRASNQTIVLTANEGRGTLNNAVIRLEHIESGEVVTLTKANQSSYRDRYDSFIITAANIATLPEGDLLYTVKAASGGDIDDSLTLESGRGRIIALTNETISEYSRSVIDYVHERAT